MYITILYNLGPYLKVCLLLHLKQLDVSNWVVVSAVSVKTFHTVSFYSHCYVVLQVKVPLLLIIEKNKLKKIFFYSAIKGLFVYLWCACGKKNSDNLLWYYKPTLNKTLFFLPFFFLSVLDEEESSVLESLPSSLLVPPHALLTCCPDAVLRIFKII